MNVLIAPDKFKGSLSAKAVAKAIAEGLSENHKDWNVEIKPMADGGDGSIAVLADILHLKKNKVSTTDPLGRPIDGYYYTSKNTAYIELATASGIALLSYGELDPTKTTTLGTGILIANSLDRGYKKIQLFLGGSATNDMAMGISTALGFRFLDNDNNPLEPIGSSLALTRKIKLSNKYNFQDIEIELICDVKNTAFGPNGAAHIFAKQKGATPRQITELDNGIRNLCKVIESQTGKDISLLNGGGAAGAVAAGLAALVNAKIKSGIQTIAELTHLEESIKKADLVISGEGNLDQQSTNGKVIGGLAALCKRYNKQLVLFVGNNELTMTEANSLDIKSVYSILNFARDLDDAMQNAESYLKKMARLL